ncbi:hypothetical protein A2697_04870 [Candidatus Curtissbacteria bacterium RIFCSPHIGHO2_01_FULL_41_44]|uniref:Uncharacterized protein n=1 Tax=Candidatus Curtissbacteria bacterium RIFCSPLOWO2_01_FULL_42_50 TaxID=1797730 RepID=A0A1F5H6B0_9BACT|nr:MAG: hypothetical protein A3C33_00320 [Candidatus Curtissbacteria bacterium RIFCSPHIGHO2_02_FULL_42_58]OGD93976.1 MAG: hypothetical protein A2697_04870 [Candidatus Curtissbacteria bacterium RIFCSPHIGHO2_01_FULL_41_44]OGD97582.1 MAG: hypothetical protein A3E71_05175 [Candidatus Curtissbacteria bacterium RIFCSPHIGHO2_12_FULL_42_33]OGD99574.1 MAG: hypothetical protein A3B54_02380 [Candidatus Curtissbacteria bacterium RIFCSPLOWO2_01_FULL_42_50]OGE02554.1 MAG: hypothetical protein A3G16_03430 [Ca
MEKLSLTRVANILKSEWILLLLGVLSIGMFLLAIFSFSSKNKGPESPTGTPWQGNIYAGKTTKEKLESILGPPEGVEGSGEQTIYKYRSNQEFRPHRVEFTENTIALIKEQVIGNEKGTLDNYIQKYGQSEKILYGEHGTFAPGHFWGQAGILVFAGQFDKTIVEIWYFAPATLENFLRQHPGLSLEEPQNFLSNPKP